MNQILNTKNSEYNENTNNYNKYKHRNKASISLILRVFVFSLLLFGVFTVSFAGYTLYDIKQSSIVNPTKPVIIQNQQDSKTLLITIEHDKELKSIEYNWNDESIQTIDASGQTSIEQILAIPSGLNTLYMSVTDVNGEIAYLEQDFETEEELLLNVLDEELEIIANLDTTISYMTYRWNDGEETKITINDTSLKEYITIPYGTNVVTIVVVDENNETIQKTQKTNAVAQPLVDIYLDEAKEFIIIDMYDAISLEKLEIIVDDEIYTTETTEKELIYEFPVEYLDDGLTTFKVVVYNSEDITTEITVNCEIIN